LQLLVSGTRHGRSDVWTELDAWLAAHGRPSLVIAGGARGVDSQAADWARARGLPLREVPVLDDEWRDLGLGAGHARNRVMVELCQPGDHLVAFPLGRSPGTRGCVDLACAAGLWSYVIETQEPWLWDPRDQKIISLAPF